MSALLYKDAPRQKEPSYNLFVSIERALSLDIVTELIGCVVRYDPAQLDAVNAQGEGALTRAVGGRRLDVVQALLAAGANPDLVGSGGVTPLRQALRLRLDGIAQALLEAGANPLLLDWQQRTMLFDAARQNLTGWCERLIDLGVEPNQATKESLRGSALHEAAASNSAGAAAVLIARGSWVDLQNTFKETPLHLCAMGDARETACVLVRAGASLTAQTHTGLTPLMTARKYGHMAFSREVQAMSSAFEAQRAMHDALEDALKDALGEAALCLPRPARKTPSP